MKNSNYLIGLAALALVGCSDNDFLGSGENITSTGNGEISFSAGSPNMTRAGEMTGQSAADKLKSKFTVYGWKTDNATSGKTDGTHEDVYQDYLVTYAANTAGTTESNTKNWEYVGNTSQPIDGAGIPQTIKYWDYSTNRYDFIGWTITGGNAVLKERKQVSSTSVAPSLKFNASTASDLGQVYISDKYTATSDGSKPTGDVLTNADHAKYSLGQYKDQEVALQFRTLSAKARIGIYETVPGYKVSDVVFYKENATIAHNYTYSETNADYTSNQSNATLYTASDVFTRSGDVTVKYHDKTYESADTKLDNTAYTTVDNATKASFFAFGQLTNTKGTGTKTAVTAGEPIGTTSPTATMSIGNDENTLYTYVFPMETNTEALNLKVNYVLTSTDGSGEVIKVTGANAQVPSNYAQWLANYAYTYLFKISDNTNGYTGGDSNPAGLYPITFDAVVINAIEGNQETITTVNDNSITTYQDGSEVTVNDEYLSAKGDIYVAIKGLPDLTAGTNIKLFIAEDKSAVENLTEEVAANYMYNAMLFTDVTALLTVNDAEIEVPNTSGAGHGIKFAANKVAKFTPAANTVYVVEYTTGGVKSYKVIKVDSANATQTYTVAVTAASVATNEVATFTVKNGSYAVTGAKSQITIKDGSGNDATLKFEITETATAGTYNVTPKTATAGAYQVYLGTATDGANKVTVTAPIWSDGTNNITSIVVEEGHSVTVKLLAKAGTPLVGVTPTVPAGITATATTADGSTTLTAAAGTSGDKVVSYNGSNLTVKVDNFTLALGVNILNVGDAEHKTTSITLTNAGTGTTVGAQEIASSTPATAAGVTLASGTATVTALAAGTTTFSYGNAKANLEVVNYVLTDNSGSAAGTIKLTKDGNAVSGAVFTTPTGISVTATSTPGVYKVTKTDGSAAADRNIEFKYKGVVVADVTINI